MFERIVNMTIRFFVSVWVVRYLGPEQYGVYSYALSFVGLFAAFSTLGLDNIVVRNLSREGASEGEILGTAFVLRVVAALGTIGIVAVTVFSVADRWLIQLAVLIVAGQLVFKAADVFDFWFQSEIKSKYPVWVRSGVTTLFAGSQVACILAGFSVLVFVGLVVMQSALQVVGTFLMYRLVRGAEDRPAWTFRWTMARRMMRDAWPLISAGLSVSVYMKIDQVMLGEMIGESAVGIYATAVKKSEVWDFIPTGIAGCGFPKIVSTKENASQEVYTERMQAFYDFVAFISYLIIVPVVISAAPVIELLFGAEYAASAPILQVHIWAFLFVSLGVARSRWLVTENFTRFAMFAAVLGAITNVGINFVLIPSYAGLGAAWATLIAQMVAAYVACLILPELRKVFIQLTRSIFLPFRLRGIGDRLRRAVEG